MLFPYSVCKPTNKNTSQRFMEQRVIRQTEKVASQLQITYLYRYNTHTSCSNNPFCSPCHLYTSCACSCKTLQPSSKALVFGKVVHSSDTVGQDISRPARSPRHHTAPCTPRPTSCTDPSSPCYRLEQMIP